MPIRRGKLVTYLILVAAVARLALVFVFDQEASAAASPTALLPVGRGRTRNLGYRPNAYAGAFSEARHKIDDLTRAVDKQGVVKNFGWKAQKLVEQSFSHVGLEGAATAALEHALDVKLEALFRRQLQVLRVMATDQYEESVLFRPNPLEAAWNAEQLFLRSATSLVRPGSTWSFETEYKDLLSWLVKAYSRDVELVEEQGNQGHGKHITLEVIRKLQQQLDSVERDAKTRGALPWDVKWQWLVDKSPIGFRGQYTGGRSVVELLLMPGQDPRQKTFLNRLGPLNLAVAFDMFA